MAALRPDDSWKRSQPFWDPWSGWEDRDSGLVERRVIWSPTGPQSEAWGSTSPITTMFGGYGSGKSYWEAHELLRAAYENPGLPIGLIGHDHLGLRRDVLSIFEALCARNGIPLEHRVMEREIVVDPDAVGTVIHLLSTQQPGRIKGVTLAAAVLDEMGKWPETLGPEVPGTTWEVVLSRVRHPRGTGKIRGGTTPEGEDGWASQTFVVGPMDLAQRVEWERDYRVVFADSRTNTHLPEYVVRRMLGSYDRVQVLEKVCGRPTAKSGGRAYYAFERTRHVQPCRYDPALGRVKVGMDFNVQPMCAVLGQDRGQTARIFHELVLPDSNTLEMSRMILRWGAARGLTGAAFDVYPDASGRARSTKGQSDFDILRQAGLKRIRAPKANPDQRERLNVVNGMLDHDRLTVDPSCEHVIRDLARVKTKKGTGEIDKSNPDLTHASDGAGYWLYQAHRIRRSA